MAEELETGVLRAVSRSFYLSLKFLPGPMRRPASIAYLLARCSDTIADTAAVPVGERLACLQDFSEKMIKPSGVGIIPDSFVSRVSDEGERELLRRCSEVFLGLESLSFSEQGLIRELLAIIIEGQRGDLEFFGQARSGAVVALRNGEELEDYCWKVAGCVGVFWTKLGYETLGAEFSDREPAELLEFAENYGKGLQLVNILRDLPEDLRDGRCYLPVADSGDRMLLMSEFERWRSLASCYVEQGREYAVCLKSRRLRLASGLPGRIARETLGMLEGVSFERLEDRIKVPRRRIYSLVVKSFFS